MTILERARDLTSKGYSVIPVNPISKKSIVKNWSPWQVNPMTAEEVEIHFKDAKGIALLTGGKKRVIGFDADMKNDLSGDLWERFLAQVPQWILDKCILQSTQNRGYHLIFIAPESRVNNSEKLASRRTTAYEKHQTYMDHFNNPDTRETAVNTAYNDKSRILFETRGGKKHCSGYVLLDPTPGYKILSGSIKELAESEYDQLIGIARSFNEYIDLSVGSKRSVHADEWEIDPVIHYSEEGDILGLLIDNGWSIVYQTDSIARLKRPGNTTSLDSAIFDKNTRVFNCFSTSTSFDPNTGYRGFKIFSLLCADNDDSKAIQMLIALGYGIKKSE